MNKFILVCFIFSGMIIASNELPAQLPNKNMYLLGNVNNHTTPYSALWGYRSPNGREYAILGCYDGTSFIDITDVNNIHQVGFLPSTDPTSTRNVWREMKTYSHYAYIVSEVANSGIQIVDLQYLPDSIHYVKKFIPTGHTSTHTISQSGAYLFLNGCNPSFGSGTTVLDLNINPETPIKRGGYNIEYIHDCRVVNDTIFAANIYVSKVSIINVTNKNTLTGITSFINLPNSGPHNTAVTTDRKYLFVTDEIGNPPMLLKVWNIQDLGNITYVTNWQPTGITTSIVHNIEIYNNFAVIAHYTAGIRMLDISNPAIPTEVAWYDTYTFDNGQSYDGCWGVYMFPSGKIIASDRSTGLYVVKTNYNINVAMEGYYDISTGQLNKSDTVRAYLRNTSSPFAIVDSSKAVIDSVTFTGNFKFNTAPNGNYYIELKHRSCLETWSRAGGEPYNPMTMKTYDFTQSDTAAFGNNMVQLKSSPLRYGLYNGDCNQDGIIDLSDIIMIYNDNTFFNTGYLSTDLNGDGFVNLTDLIIAFNNSVKFINKITP